MNKPFLLVVEDDHAVRNLITTTLETQDYKYHTAVNGNQALMEAVSQHPDIILLDLGLPDIDGVDVIKKIRTWSNVPIIVISARSEDQDKIDALDAGADDYLTKPFSIKELMARVNSLIRRYTTLNPTFAEEDCITLKGMKIDKVNRTVLVNNISVELTSKEFDLLTFLASNKGRIFTKKQIYTQVWKDDYAFDDNNIMSFISKLRKKIEADPEHPFYILTIRGVGYRFNKEA